MGDGGVQVPGGGNRVKRKASPEPTQSPPQRWHLTAAAVVRADNPHKAQLPSCPAVPLAFRARVQTGEEPRPPLDGAP